MSTSVAQEQQRKLAFERVLRPKVLGIFNALAITYVRVLNSTGTILDAQARAGVPLEKVFLNHYVRVGNHFGYQMRKQMPVDLAIEAEEMAEIDALMTEAFVFKAPEQARIVLATTQQNMVDALTMAQAEQARLSSIGEFMAPITLHVVAGRYLERKLMGRLTGIASFESQWPAEMSKVIEVAVLIGEQDDFEYKAAKRVTSIKEWSSFTDSRVRDTHLMADTGVAIAASKPFKVGSSLLMWPGDTSLGASQEELQHCRCSAVYKVSNVKTLRRILKRTAVFEDEAGKPTGGIIRAFQPGKDLKPLATKSDLIVVGELTPKGGGVPTLNTGAPSVPALPKIKLPKKSKAKKVLKAKLPKQDAKPTKDFIKESTPENRVEHIKRFKGDTTLLDDFDSFEDMLGPERFKYWDDGELGILWHNEDKSLMGFIHVFDKHWADTRKRYRRAFSIGDTMPDWQQMQTFERHTARMIEGMRDFGIDPAIQNKIIEGLAELGSREAQIIAHGRASSFKLFKNRKWSRNHYYFDREEALKVARQEMKEAGISFKSVHDPKSSFLPLIDKSLQFQVQVRGALKALNKKNDIKPASISKHLRNKTGPPEGTALALDANSETMELAVRTIRDIADDGVAAGSLFSEAQGEMFTRLRIATSKTHRAFASPGGNTIALDAVQEARDVIAHEFGHHIEYRSRVTRNRIKVWSDDRIAIAKANGEKLSNVYGGAGTGPGTEVGWKDGFFDHYVGKQYRVGAFDEYYGEATSMGIQTLYNSLYLAKAIRDDPEHLELMWAILRGY